MYPAAAICRCHIDGAAALSDDAAMIKSIAFAMVAFAMLPFACGSSAPANPVEFCQKSFALACDKVYSCVPVADQDATFVATFGTSLADCKGAVLKTSCEGSTCNGPYNSSLAETCLNKAAGLTCADLASGNTPTECDSACP
jgi:hypothetical protein